MKETLTEINFVNIQEEGLDWDTDEVMIAPGNSRYRLCCRSDNTGTIKNFKGHKLITFGLPPGLNKTMFACQDMAENYMVYGIYNSNGNNIILKFTYSTNALQLVLGAPNDLNFDPDYPIYNARVSGDVLFFSDGKNEPRSFNIERAIAHTAGTGTGDPYLVIDEQVLNAIKYPPLAAPQVEPGSDPNTNVNNVVGKMWQFAYRWVYYDNAKSTISPISKVVKPKAAELNVGINYIDSLNSDNFIKITLETGVEIVARIELLARDSNISEWFLVKVLDKEELSIASRTTYDYDFYNNNVRYSLDQSDINRLYDLIPRKAKHQEIINGEYLLYANYLDGYDNIDIDVNISKTKTGTIGDVAITPIVGVVNVPGLNVLYDLGSVIPIGTRYSFNIKLKDTVSGNWDAYYDSGQDTDAISFVISYTVSGGKTLSGIATDIAKTINSRMDVFYKSPVMPLIVFAEPTPTATGYGIKLNASFHVYYDPFIPYIPIYLVNSSLFSISSSININAYKSGSYHKFAIAYSDEKGRLGFAQTNDNMRIYIPYWSEDEPGLDHNDIRYYELQYAINHRPPVWAHKAYLLYSKNLTVLSFIQFFASTFPSFLKSKGTYYEIEINKHVINQALTDNPRYVFSPYSWQKGDRLRIMYKSTTAITSYKNATKMFDVEIIGQDETNGNIRIPLINFTDYGISPTIVIDGVLLEIYTPNKEQFEIETFWEIGEEIDIEDPGTENRQHKGNLTTQTAQLPAEGKIGGGDIYWRMRIDHSSSNKNLYPCETSSYSDYYFSNDFDYGRIIIFNKDAKSKWLKSHYRVGGRYIQQSKLNNMFRFGIDEVDWVGDAFGEITGVRQVGDTIKIYQENKLTSQYIFRVSFVDARGQENLQRSDKMLGTKIISKYDYGCRDAGSIVVNERYVYFLDANRGIFCRDAANGVFPISNYKMKRFWREKADVMNTNRGKYDVNCGYNVAYNELTISVVPHINTQGEYYFDPFTVIFMEGENRWKTFLPIVPDKYCLLGDRLISFKDGQMYLHDTTNVYNNFHGVQYDMRIEVYGNMPPFANKVFDAIAIHSNSKFYAPDTGDIEIFPTESYPDGMKSRLKDTRFELKEGVYYASFLNDMTDPAFTDQGEALFRGRNLRGKVAKVLLRNISTDETVLEYVVIKATTSDIIT